MPRTATTPMTARSKSRSGQSMRPPAQPCRAILSPSTWGIYRERVIPPRGGTSDKKRIVYQAAAGEEVIITGSEPAKGWTKVQGETWKLTLPNTFFGGTNPFDEQIYGSWYRGKGKPNHTGSVYLNGKRIRETFSLADVLSPIGEQPYWYAEADGNGGPVLMNFEWVRPAGGTLMNSMQASVEGGDQSVCIAITHRWPFGYLKDGSKLYFDNLDFGTGTDTVYFQAATLAKGGIVEMRLGTPDGEYLGSSMVTNTGDWEEFAVFSLKMGRKLSGKQNICFVLKAPALKENGKTTIWAQFPNGIDPNEAPVEISVRPQVFYPDRAGIDYLTVRGFILENAATNWAPPSAKQPGLIGTRWGKGWIIENNTVRNSRCAGIALGRPTYGHTHHYHPQLPPRVYAEAGSGQTAGQLCDYFQNASWDKEATGHHIVRNNHIYECGQVGIVGCSGAAFSLIEHNEIHDVCLGETFEGDEMAGIKLHFANDAVLRNNHIYRTVRGLWLDWGGQDVQIIGNLLHDNNPGEDIFVEVCHGPILIANNFLFSQKSLIVSQGVAGIYNLICGKVEGGMDRCAGGRMSYYYKPHGTVSLGKAPNPGGDYQWQNNLLTRREAFGKWDAPKLPISYAGNAIVPLDASLTQKADGWYVTLDLPAGWDAGEKRKIVTTSTLTNAIVPNQPYTNPVGSVLKVNTDYFGKKRNSSNPAPGQWN